MRKILLNVAVSLDGYIEGPNGEYDWCFTDQDYGMTDFYQQIDSTFMGRKSYELMLSMGDVEVPNAPVLKNYVFSQTLEKVKPGYFLVKGDIKKEIDHIKSQDGKDIWLFGGAGLTKSLLLLGLIDRIGLAVHPIILGGGTPLFHNLPMRTKLRLISSKEFSSGLVYLTYQMA